MSNLSRCISSALSKEAWVWIKCEFIFQRKKKVIIMRTRYAFMLLSILQMPQLAMALDFSKPSEAASGEAANNEFMRTITKEKLFDILCEKVEVIKKKPSDAKVNLQFLSHPMVSGGRLYAGNENIAPPIVTDGVFIQAFYNSYGNDLKKNKNCQDAPYRIDPEINYLFRYYATKSPDDKNMAIQGMEEARKLPKGCGEKVVDFLTYVDKRLEQCIK